MANPRQHRKARSSAHKTVKHSRHAKRNLKKMKPIRGPKPLQDAWDNKKTLRQNYAAMGLVGSLKQADSGGSEHPVIPTAVSTTRATGESAAQTAKGKSSRFGKILRDAEGNVVGVELPEEDDDEENENDAEMEDETVGEQTELVEALEKLAKTSRLVPRFSSGAEVTELKKLMAKHGQDFEAMSKDGRLNPLQRTAGQLRRAGKKAGLV